VQVFGQGMDELEAAMNESPLYEGLYEGILSNME
jgi:hypothetical protein